MINRARSQTVFSFGTFRDTTWVLSVALIWFLFHTVPLDKHSAINISLILLLALLGLGLPALEDFSSGAAKVLFILFGLFGLTVVTGLLHTGDLRNPRASVLILLIVLLGVAVGFARKQIMLLLGLGFGTLAVQAQGVFFQYFDPARSLLSGPYLGVSGRESSEIISSFIGLAAGFVLLHERGFKKYFAALLVLVNSFMIWRIDLTIGVVAAAFMFLIASLVWANGKTELVISRTRMAWGFVVTAILLSAFVAARSAALAVAEYFGQRDSVEARFEIWDSAISSVSTSGIIFGYGASFWREGSDTITLAHKALDNYGLSAFVHSHSMYVDLFLSFGLVGLAMIASLIATLFRRSNLMRSEAPMGVAERFLWVSLPSLGVFGISESVLILYPTGWFLWGVFLGLLLPKTGRNFSTEFGAK